MNQRSLLRLQNGDNRLYTAASGGGHRQEYAASLFGPRRVCEDARPGRLQRCRQAQPDRDSGASPGIHWSWGAFETAGRKSARSGEFARPPGATTHISVGQTPQTLPGLSRLFLAKTDHSGFRRWHVISIRRYVRSQAPGGEARSRDSASTSVPTGSPLNCRRWTVRTRLFAEPGPQVIT